LSWSSAASSSTWRPTGVCVPCAASSSPCTHSNCSTRGTSSRILMGMFSTLSSYQLPGTVLVCVCVCGGGYVCVCVCLCVCVVWWWVLVGVCWCLGVCVCGCLLSRDCAYPKHGRDIQR